jgi:hypothetical protein
MLMLLTIIYLLISKCKCEIDSRKEEFSQNIENFKGVQGSKGFFKQSIPWWVIILIIIVVYLLASLILYGNPFSILILEGIFELIASIFK